MQAQTWLLILRGDPAEGGVPIGVVTERELCLAAVRAAWAAFQQIYAEERHDPALRAGVEGMDRRLRLAAEDLAGPVGTAPATLAPRTPPGRFGTPQWTLTCRRQGCGASFVPSASQRGSEQTYCSGRCRRLASRERLRAARTDGGAA